MIFTELSPAQKKLNVFFQQLLEDLRAPSLLVVLDPATNKVVRYDGDVRERPEVGTDQSIRKAVWYGARNDSNNYYWISLELSTHLRGLVITTGGKPTGTAKMEFTVLGLTDLVDAPGSNVFSGPSGYAVARAIKSHINAMYDE
jgi:hypothetical protein